MKKISHPVERDMLDIIFANRNRVYGAYQLRRDYPNYLGRALGLGLLFIGLFLVLPRLLNAVSNAFERELPTEVTVTLTAPPASKAETPPPLPPPPAPAPPPTRATQAVVPPVVVEDEKAPDEPVQTVEEILNNKAEISSKDQEGDTEGPPDLDDPILTSKIETAVTPPAEEEPHTMATVQKAPGFPGGDKELLKFLAENIKYPPLARESNIQGVSVLTFIVNKDGSISDVAVLRPIGGGCDKEAVRVVQSMPRWTPGEANGHLVKVRFTLPVRFRLE